MWPSVRAGSSLDRRSCRPRSMNWRRYDPNAVQTVADNVDEIKSYSFLDLLFIFCEVSNQ